MLSFWIGCAKLSMTSTSATWLLDDNPSLDISVDIRVKFIRGLRYHDGCDYFPVWLDILVAPCSQSGLVGYNPHLPIVTCQLPLVELCSLRATLVHVDWPITTVHRLPFLWRFLRFSPRFNRHAHDKLS
jgi:hypothetical protein